MSGTKKQKMDMSHAIVAAVYSMNPPGRFLKQCPDTGKWSELSERDAVERAAQAMGYAIRDKDDLKRKRDERRRSPRRSSRQKSSTEADDGDGDDVAAEALSSLSASAPHHLSAVRASSAGDDMNNTLVGSSTAAQNDCSGSGLSAADVMGMPLPPSSQLHQASNAINHHPTSTNQYLNQWIQEVLAQAAQQQPQQQILQNYNLRQNSLGQLPHSQTQTPLQPDASLDVATHQPVDQAQQLQQLILQQQQWQNQFQQQDIPLQNILNNLQNALPSDLLATLLSSLAQSSASLGASPIPNANVASSNYSSTTQSHLTANNIDISHIQQQQSSNPSTALLLSSVLSNLQYQPNNNGILSAPQGAQQSNQLQQLSLMQPQQQQLLAPPLSAASNQYLGQQQQSLLLDPLYQAWMTAMLQQIQNSSQPPPSINAQPSSANAEADADAAPASTRQECNEDEQQSVSEEEQTK